jgi:trk system potassium uptake protein TrkA
MKQILVIGLGRFGYSLAEALYEDKYDVLAIDIDPERVREVSKTVPHVIQGDATNKEVLENIGARNFDIAVVGIGENILVSILTSMLLIESGIPKVIARAQTREHSQILKKIGVHEIVFPEKDRAYRLSKQLAFEEVSQQLEIVPGYHIYKMEAKEKMIGKELKELEWNKKFDISIVTLVDAQNKIITPRGDTKIEENDKLFLFASEKSMKKFLEKYE